MTTTGHNSISAARLKSFIERAERLGVDKGNLSADMKEMWSEAKGEGFDVKIMKRVVKLRKLDPADRAEEDALVDVYMNAVEG